MKYKFQTMKTHELVHMRERFCNSGSIGLTSSENGEAKMKDVKKIMVQSPKGRNHMPFLASALTLAAVQKRLEPHADADSARPTTPNPSHHEVHVKISATTRGRFDNSGKEPITFGWDGTPNMPAIHTRPELMFLRDVVVSRFGEQLLSFSTIAEYHALLPPVCSHDPPFPIPVEVLQSMSYDALFRAKASSENKCHLQFRRDYGATSLGQLELMFTPTHDLGDKVKAGTLLFLVRKIMQHQDCPDGPWSRNPPHGACLECRQIVLSKCCDLVYVTTANEANCFDVILASQIMCPVLLVEVFHHPRLGRKLYARNRLLHTVIRGDVPEFPKMGSLSPLACVPPVDCRANVSAVDSDEEPKTKKRPSQLIATVSKPASSLRIEVEDSGISRRRARKY